MGVYKMPKDLEMNVIDEIKFINDNSNLDQSTKKDLLKQLDKVLKIYSNVNYSTLLEDSNGNWSMLSNH